MLNVKLIILHVHLWIMDLDVKSIREVVLIILIVIHVQLLPQVNAFSAQLA